MKYYCWEKYYDHDTHIQTSSDEILYFQGHQHGVQPSPANWLTCLGDLVLKVNAIRAAHHLDALPTVAIQEEAERCTRSEH